MMSAVRLLLLPALLLACPDLRPAAPTNTPASEAVTTHPVLRVRPDASVAAKAEANRLYATLLDSVGLYTLIGNLKPMSDILARRDRRPLTPDLTSTPKMYTRN